MLGLGQPALGAPGGGGRSIQRSPQDPCGWTGENKSLKAELGGGDGRASGVLAGIGNSLGDKGDPETFSDSRAGGPESLKAPPLFP